MTKYEFRRDYLRPMQLFGKRIGQFISQVWIYVFFIASCFIFYKLGQSNSDDRRDYMIVSNGCVNNKGILFVKAEHIYWGKADGFNYYCDWDSAMEGIR